MTTTEAARQVFLTARAAENADRFEHCADPESDALGTFTAMTALLCMRIAQVDIAERAVGDAREVLRAKQLGNAVEQMNEALDLLNGWHAAQDRLAARRRAENALSTVVWPDGGDAA